MVSNVLDRNKPQSGPGYGPAGYGLTLEPRPRVQLAIIELLGREGTNVRMKPPGFVQKQALLGANGASALQHMIEGGCIGAFGMTALHWLIKLARITEENERLRRLRHRKHICQGHLGRFVDEKNINTSMRFRR